MELGLIRNYGKPPYTVAVIHGGPGAAGYMAPVARQLGQHYGVLEPLQSANSVQGQISELNAQLLSQSQKAMCLIASSWGAVLALLYAAQFPTMCTKVIIIGSAVFDAQSSAAVKKTRMARLSEQSKQQLAELENQLQHSNQSQRQNQILQQIAEYYFDTDSYLPLTRDLEIINYDYQIHQAVWQDFISLRDTNGLLQALFSSIEIPVVNLHGDYDPHLITGIQPFLQACIKKIDLHIINQCGHYPWLEKQAKNEFYQLLQLELSKVNSARA